MVSGDVYLEVIKQYTFGGVSLLHNNVQLIR